MIAKIKRWLFCKHGVHSFSNFLEWHVGAVRQKNWAYKFGRHCRYCGCWEVLK